MDSSRRDFLKGSGVAALGGTALGSLAAVGAGLAPTVARAQELRIKHAKAVPSVCPYCAVGCGTLVHVADGKILNIEGDPRSLSFAKTSCGRQVVDQSALMQPSFQLDDLSPTPPASASPLPLWRPPPVGSRESGLASAAHRLQTNGDPAAAPQK